MSITVTSRRTRPSWSGACRLSGGGRHLHSPSDPPRVAMTMLENPEAVVRALASQGYLADDRIAQVVFLADPARQAGAGGGPCRGGQDRAGQGPGRRAGPAPDPPPVLRGPRRGQGAVRVELPQAAAAAPGRSGPGVGGGRGRHLHRGLPADPAAAGGDPLARTGGAADRRGRPRRGGDRGAAPRGAQSTSRCRSPNWARSPPPPARRWCSPRTTPGSCRRPSSGAASSSTSGIPTVERETEILLDPGPRARSRAGRSGGPSCGRIRGAAAAQAALGERVDRLGADPARPRGGASSTNVPWPTPSTCCSSIRPTSIRFARTWRPPRPG